MQSQGHLCGRCSDHSLAISEASLKFAILSECMVGITARVPGGGALQGQACSQLKTAGRPGGRAEKFLSTPNSRQKSTRKEKVLSPTKPGNSGGGRFGIMIEAGITKGLDWRKDYHIIKNSFKGATAGSGAAGKTWGPGGAPRRIFQKKH